MITALLIASMLGVPSTVRSDHYTDQVASGNTRTRTVGQWLNYRDSAGAWYATNVTVAASTGQPPDWSGGTYAYTQQSISGPMQLWFGYTADPGNQTRLAARYSDKPNQWMELQALNVNDVAPTIQAANRRVVWTNLWTNTHLAYIATPGGFDKGLQLTSAGHPATFTWAIRLPIGASLAASADGGIDIKKSGGANVMHMNAPFGWDSTGGDATGPVAGYTPIRATLALGAMVNDPGYTTQKVVLTPNTDDLEAATYPVYLDPSTTISGTTNTDDNLAIENSPHSNGGAYAFLGFGADGAGTCYISWIKFASSAFPQGAITDTHLIIKRAAAPQSQNGSTVYAYRVNKAWNEGNKNFAAAGSDEIDYTDAKHGTTAWSAAGCRQSGTDFVADASPPSLAYSACTDCGTPDSDWDLGDDGDDWVEGWRDGTYNNNGFVLLENACKTVGGTANTLFNLRSSEWGATGPNLVITYIPNQYFLMPPN